MKECNVVNVVATASLYQKMNLPELSVFPEVKFNPLVYSGNVAFFKQNCMVGRICIWSSGKLISVGTKSELQSQKELLSVKQYLVDKGLIKDVELQIFTQNIVATADFGQTLTLEELSTRIQAIYEPEQFSGAILRFKQPFRASVLLFASGKIVITGLKSTGQIEPTIQKLKQLIESKQ